MCVRREYEELCQEFVDSAKKYCPELLQKVKVHLLLHLVDCMVDFGTLHCLHHRKVNTV